MIGFLFGCVEFFFFCLLCVGVVIGYFVDGGFGDFFFVEVGVGGFVVDGGDVYFYELV